ncbi:helix-turn-helix domain-containing protein [Paractinoplanes durhamensis]|uniref:Transcriptional regulator n=1 Tax=Paractinoplanes durhamensis TaxID=113563 RepID=A0ABQ3Z1C3_9ACTN|nr:helix-turn-helix transcriptional regulator [Actinoplanes durhamensis]GIE03621.1 transcriptional regulator [Actinoplanes durhamensis]
MAEDVSPTIARRIVRLALRDAREKAKLTQPHVAEAMEWSLSKVIRIENGDVSIAPNDLKPLLTFLDVKDRTVVANLVDLAKIARTRQRTAWYQKPGMKEHLTPPMLRLVEYEAEAVEIRYYQVYYMPGPLQVPAYGHANLETYTDDDIPEETRRLRIEARTFRRNTVLSRLGNGLTIFALLDESVFRRPLGGPEVFLEQLRDLNDLVATGNIKLRMIPFEFDSAVTNNATFDLLTLTPGTAEERSEVLYRETGLQDEIVEDHTVRKHHERFDKIWNAAVTEEDTIDFMGSRIKDLEAQIRHRKNP